MRSPKACYIKCISHNFHYPSFTVPATLLMAAWRRRNACIASSNLEKQIPHTTKEMNRSRTHTNTHRKPRTLPKAFVKNREIKKTLRLSCVFRCAFAAFIYFFIFFLFCFLFYRTRVLVCVRVLRIYADHGWNFFHTFCTTTMAELLPRLIALRRLLTFFCSFFAFFS